MDTEHKPTVLVVDDEERLVDLFAAWLSDEYVVRTAYGGQEALELLDGDVRAAGQRGRRRGADARAV